MKNSVQQLTFGLIVVVAVGAVAFVVAAAAAEQTPEQVSADVLVEQVERELAQLKADYRRTINQRYPALLSQAELLSVRRPGKDGLALKQMANLYAKVEQIKYAAQRYGLRATKQILGEQFANDGTVAAADGSLKLQVKFGPLLVERAKLRSIVDAYLYGDIKQWRELYQLINKFVRPDSKSLYPELHQLASEAHAARFAHQKLAKDVYLRQEELLEELAGSEQEAATLLAHVDNILDAATKCAECRQLESAKDETNFFTYPLASEQQLENMIEPVDGLESGLRQLRPKLFPKEIGQNLDKIDEEDIGFQGEEFLGEQF